jgi:hypothetical protein
MSPQGMGTATCFVELLHNGKGHGKIRKFAKLVIKDCLYEPSFPNLLSVDKLMVGNGGEPTGNYIDFTDRTVTLSNGASFRIERYSGLYASRIYSTQEMITMQQV